MTLPRTVADVLADHVAFEVSLASLMGSWQATFEGRRSCAGAATTVRAENPVHRCDQQSWVSRRPAVMITDHVPAVRLPPDHAGGLMAAAVAA